MAISKFMRAALRLLSYNEPDVTLDYQLQRRLSAAARFYAFLPSFKMWDHTVPRDGYDIPVRIFSPHEEEEHRNAVLLFFHGGGWVKGNIDSYTRVCADMARLTKCAVVSVDYRLAPEYRFPTAPEDCYAVAKEIFLHADLLRVDPKNIVLIGDSAGGNLAAAVSLMAKDRGEFMPNHQILIYPATYSDHSEKSLFPSVKENGTDYLLTSKRVSEYMELYQGSPEDVKNPYFAPLLAQDLTGQPNTLILTAEFDPLRDEGEAYGEKLAKFGCRVEVHRTPDALHGYFSLPPSFGQVKESYQLINRFLSEVAPLETEEIREMEPSG